jgi:hypothetical protein
MATPNIEFTEVLTTPDLLPSSSPTPANETFPTVITETSLLSSPPSSESSFSRTTAITPEKPADLIQMYDTTFEDIQQYHDFVHRKLFLWKDSLELKHFHSSYMHHRTIRKSIADLRHQAQQLLEQANRLQTHHDSQMVDFQKFIPTIANKDLDYLIRRPSKVYPKPPRRPDMSPRPLPSITTPRLSSSNRQSPLRNSPSRLNPLPGFLPSRSHPGSSSQATTLYRCFQCNSKEHIKWFCPQYRCPLCKEISPGHSQGTCPVRQQTLQDVLDHQRDLNYHLGLYDIDSDDYGNLAGEC